MFNDRLIEVKSGLVEGDQVLLSPLSASDNVDLGGSIAPDEGDTNSRPAFKRDNEGTNAEPVKIRPPKTNRPPVRYSSPDAESTSSTRRDRGSTGGGGSRDRGPRP
jgi:hypothetical protein